MMTKEDVTSKVALITGSGRHRVGNVVAGALGKRGYAIGLHYHWREAGKLILVRFKPCKEMP